MNIAGVNVEPGPVDSKDPWAFAMIGVWLWGLLSCIHIWYKHVFPRMRVDRCSMVPGLTSFFTPERFSRMHYLRTATKHCARIVFVGIPIFLVYVVLVFLLFASCTTLTLNVIYNWGDCLARMEET